MRGPRRPPKLAPVLDPVRQVVDRIEALEPEWIHGMHGGSLARAAVPYFTRALREHVFAYHGKVLGRAITNSPHDTLPT